MNDPRYFVLVFGDPKENGDTLEAERYTSGDRYAAFTVSPGDLLLLYCTEGYQPYSKKFPGIGVAIETSNELIRYRIIPFAAPAARSVIEQTFDPEDRAKMGQLRFNQRRAFEINKVSFLRTIAGQSL